MNNSSIPNISLESTVLYPMYFRRYGVRRAVQLVSPILAPISKLEIPLNSILHFISDDDSLTGIPTDDLILANVERLMLVHHNLELGDTLGPPRPTRLPPGSMIREYHRKYRKTRWSTKVEVALKDPRTLLIENYALLPHLFRYTTSYFRSYYKWWNIQSAMWKRVSDLSKLSKRNQFIQVKLPKQLPSLAQLRRGETRLSRKMLSDFSEPESLFILELWKWLGPNRKTSVLSKASVEELSNLNIIWNESGKWIMINLGLLDQWRKPTDEEMEAGVEKHGLIDPIQLQRRFLRTLMFLFEARTTATTDEVLTEDTTVSELPEKEEVSGKEDTNTKPTLSIKVPKTENNSVKKLNLKINLNIDNLPEHPLEETEENIRLIDEFITKDLESLDKVIVTNEPDLDELDFPEVKTAIGSLPTIKYVPNERSLEEGIMSKADALADAGLLSGAEYRRFTALSGAYTKLPDPYGKEETLADQIKLDPLKLKITKENLLEDIKTVFDKSMLHSSVLEFDSRYVKEVLQKDITRSVLAVQHAGIAITDYKVEEVEDSLNHYEAHSVQLTPTIGKVSTINFRIPKVKENGTFIVGGTKYKLRKQRGD